MHIYNKYILFYFMVPINVTWEYLKYRKQDDNKYY